WDKISNIWDTARRAWLRFDPNADWHIVVQDDLIIGKNFLQNVEKYLDDTDAVFSFYMGKRPRFKNMIESVQKKGGDRLVMDNIHHECCLAFPTKRIKEM